MCKDNHTDCKINDKSKFMSCPDETFQPDFTFPQFYVGSTKLRDIAEIHEHRLLEYYTDEVDLKTK